MDMLSFLSSVAIVLCISYAIIEIIDYFEIASSSPDLKIFTNSNSVFISSSEMFYFELFRFMFDYEGTELVHFRDDLSRIRKGKVFEKLVRTNEPYIIKEVSIQLNSTSHSRLVLKSSSFIIVENTSEMDQDLLFKRERIRLESRNFYLISGRSIFDDRVMELTAIRRTISNNINEIINI